MRKPQKNDEKANQELARMPFDDALRKILSAPPAHKVKPKPKQKKKTG